MRGFVTDDELVELYANSLGVCYLPFDEDYGYVTLEAMLSGKPVVVPSDGGGAAELVEHNSTGVIVDSEPQAIADCWTRSMTTGARALTMGERGQEKAEVNEHLVGQGCRKVN